MRRKRALCFIVASGVIVILLVAAFAFFHTKGAQLPAPPAESAGLDALGQVAVRQPAD